MPTKTLSIPVHDGRKFTWDGRHGFAEASDLDCAGHRPIHSCVWPDAADVGFRVKSHKTGKMVLFTCHKTQIDDGEVVGWEYRSYGEIEAFMITIEND